MSSPIRLAAVLLVCVGAAAALPRPEFPEPQFERADWIPLNGPWQFAFDDTNAGVDGRWFIPDHTFGRMIEVPYCFESRLSGIAETGFHPWVWYRREVNIPETWRGRRTLLHFGAVDYRATVWVNGQIAGSHEGGNTPFAFDITPLLRGGPNVVTVRAWDPPQDKLIPRGKQYWELNSKSIFYTRTSGIWQSVWLESAGPAYLERVHIVPDPLGGVTFNGIFDGARSGDQLRISILDGEAEVSVGAAAIDQNRAALAMSVAHPLLWSPDNPKLYDVNVEVWRGDKMLDRVHSYFGFRTVETRDGRVLLNGKPIYLKFVLDQGYWPDSILTPPTDEAIQFDIAAAKEMGFNGARKHQKVEDPRFLYWADRMGFLVSGEMANAQGFDDQYADRFTREWTEAVLRDINHPSIIIWAPCRICATSGSRCT
jgi:beta-galactosidase/beta-glucuronidase